MTIFGGKTKKRRKRGKPTGDIVKFDEIIRRVEGAYDTKIFGTPAYTKLFAEFGQRNFKLGDVDRAKVAELCQKAREGR